MIFLLYEEVLTIHQDQVNRYGGVHGVRDKDLLLSAIAMPSATYDQHFLHGDVIEMAAAYLFHLVKNHPFIDGNKRVGAVASLVFLELNGHRLLASEQDFLDMVVGVASGQLTKADATSFFRKWSRAKS